MRFDFENESSTGIAAPFKSTAVGAPEMSQDDAAAIAAASKLVSEFIVNFTSAVFEARDTIVHDGVVDLEELCRAQANALQMNAEAAEIMARHLAVTRTQWGVEFFTKWRQVFDDAATSLRNTQLSAAARLDALKDGLDARFARYFPTVAGNAALSRIVGKLGIAFDIAQVSAALLQGDMRKFSEAAGGLVIGYIGGELAAIAASAAVAAGSIPAWPAALLVGLAAGASNIIGNAIGGAIFDLIDGKPDVAQILPSYQLAWGTADADVLLPGGDPMDRYFLVAGDGDDILYGREADDLLVGGNGADSLDGAGGNDYLTGNDDDDFLAGGSGDDVLEGGGGLDVYRFASTDFASGASTDTIVDSDGQGRITFNDLDISGTGIGFDHISADTPGTWLTSDDQFRLSVFGAEGEQSLLIIDRETGSRIVVQNWHNGDLGISLPGFDETHPPGNDPLTNDNDLFNHAGTGADRVDALAGNDGLVGGSGDDVLEGGLGNDLIFGGAGDDQLSGSDGDDTIIDGSEYVQLADFADPQQAEQAIAALGAALISRGKGWYTYLDDANGTTGTVTIVHSGGSGAFDPNVAPSGDDVISAGDGADRVFAGEGNDVISGGDGADHLNGGHDNDFIGGGDGDDTILGDLSDDAVPTVTFTALVSDQANPNGNDVLDGGAGNDTIAGCGGNDIVYGGIGDDQLYGRGLSEAVDADDGDSDYLDGGAGNDHLVGDDGDDTLLGGAGNDQIRGDDERATTRSGNDHIDGGAGDDQLAGDGGDDEVLGGDGADYLLGDDSDVAAAVHGRDRLDGGAGNDTLVGGGGDDTLAGGDGDDLLAGDDEESRLPLAFHGNDSLAGGAGNDQLQGGGGDDVLDGGAGDDKLFGDAGADRLDGGAGLDQLSGGSGGDQLDGGAGDDLLWGEDGDDMLAGGAGIDQLVGGDGADTLSGGDGADKLYGSGGNDRLAGGIGNDYLDGDDASSAQGDDTIDADDGDDIVHGMGGNDIIRGGAGDDNLMGDDFDRAVQGDDQVFGGTGNDQIDGGGGNDVLAGDEGNDAIAGGAGDDDLTGGIGNDWMAGGAGNDTYRFELGFGNDQINCDGGGLDLIVFGATIAQSELSYRVNGDDLIISNTSSGDSLSVRDYFNPAYTVDLEFAGGARITREQLMQALHVGVATGYTDGDDVIVGTAASERLYGGGGNDTIRGGGGNDYLNGGDGNDTLSCAVGSNDTLEGGAGNDTYIFGTYNGVGTVIGLADGDSGSDIIRMTGGLTYDKINNIQVSGDDLMIAYMDGSNPGAVVYLQGFLATTNGTHVIQFDDGTQLVADDFRNGANRWEGGAGDDSYNGTAASDSAYGGNGNDVLSGGDGADRIYGDAGNDTLKGDAGNDMLQGGSGADVLDGGEGNDQLYGVDPDMAGDTMRGGTGDDRYYVGPNATGYSYGWFGSPDSVIESPDEGIDTVYAGSHSYSLPDNVENLVAQPYDQHFDNTNALFPGWRQEIPRALVGNALDNTITALNSGHPYLLDGGAGADTLVGTAYDDIYVVDQAGDRIIESGMSSVDTVRASYSYALGGNTNLEIIELVGSEALSAWGNAGNNILDGSTAAGANSLSGGLGDDTYVVGAGDQVIEAAGEGVDTVLIGGRDSAVLWTNTFSLDDYANVENMTLGAPTFRGDTSGNLLGNAADNVLTGNGLLNTIHGGDGNDTLVGGEATLHAAYMAGHDELFGDGGNDTLRASSGGASLHGGSGDDALYGADYAADDFCYAIGDGRDTVHSSGGSALDRVVFDANVTPDDVAFSREGTTLVVQVGANPNDQVRVENYWIDTPDGLVLSGAVDQFVFADGTVRRGDLDQLPITNNPPVTLTSVVDLDTIGDQAFSFVLPQGIFSDAADDTVTLSLGANAPAWLQLDAATGTLAGTAPNGGLETSVQIVATDSWGQTATATLAVHVRNVIEGSAADDTLVGTSLRDDIHAGGGNDTLDGAGGADRLYGGPGDDRYLIGDGEADIVELAGEGTDTVNASTDYVLGDNVERLVLAADSAAYEGVGNDGDNEIVGNASDNRLDGAGGADLLTGGAGDDTYCVDQSGDRIVENADEGEDTVEASIGWQLGDNLERLTLVGTDDIAGIGNSLDNVLLGNEGNNRLEGGDGVDELRGGLGDDYLVLESGDDSAVEEVDQGNDTIERRYETNLVLEDNIENLVLADGTLGGNGNELNNVLVGNAGDNRLAGLNGDDELSGLGGNDALWGGDGDDRLLGGEGDDYLEGGAGLDTLDGGMGDDNYLVADASDVIVEDVDGGNDQVQASVSYVLSAGVENLFLTGTASDGSGNALDNYLAGNGGDNVVHGMGGNDTLVGDGGDDTLVGGTGDDVYVLGGDAGSDVVDNAGGGNDGIFFTDGVGRERLSFDRDGDDLLIFIDGGATPAVRVTNHFLGGDAAIDYVQPDGGFMLTTAQINQIVNNGTGGGFEHTITGTAASEQLVGSAGTDLVMGLAGDDSLFGMAGDDTLQGGDGADYLAGGNGNGSGSGQDRLEGGAGDDTLAGEDGDDVLIGGGGDDAYVHGGGQDTIDNTGGGYDGIFFNDGIDSSRLTFARDGDDLVIAVDGDVENSLRVQGHFLGGDSAIDYVQPANGPMLDTQAINALVGDGGGGGEDAGGDTGNDADYPHVVDGTAAGEQLLGTSGRDLIHGLGGNDVIFGFGGDDKFEGGDGDDYLSGGNGSFSGSGNDILVGGAGVDTLVGEDGNDRLFGGAGDDKYLFKAGTGRDVIDNRGGGSDWVFFNGIDRSRLSFHRDDDDLVILIDGDPNQQVRVLNQFIGGEYAIAYVQPADGYAIPASAFAGLLTPLPVGAGVAGEFAAAAAVAGAAEYEASAFSGTWDTHGVSISRGGPSWRRETLTADAGNGLEVVAKPYRVEAVHARSVDLLIDAIASFGSGRHGATMARDDIAASAPLLSIPHAQIDLHPSSVHHYVQ
jgi:Ca2+-binding RTX toxin-like protein